MTHLTESQLNEYLDKALSAPEQGILEQHLSGCADCRNKMETLRSLFHMLDGLPEESLTHDLAPLVMDRLPDRKIGLGWKLVIAFQTGIAIGLAILVATDLLPLISLPNTFTAFTLSLTSIELPTIHYHMPTLNFQTSPANLIFLAASALILWAVGNAALLRSRRGVQK
jgi:hypothetical protein